jgi:hypothetical protein
MPARREPEVRRPTVPPHLPVLVVLGLLAACFDTRALAAEKKGAGDRYWTSSDPLVGGVGSIALLPPATFDGNVENRRLVETALDQALRTSGHRWASTFIVRDNLLKAGGDSLLKALNDKLLQHTRADSLDAPFLCRLLRARALLTVRVDQMERRQLEANQSGRPATSVQLRAALVDSTGRLLWTAQSSETMEGAYQEAGGNVIGVRASGLNNQAVGGTSAPPLYQEVLGKIGERWRAAFPRKAAPDTSRTRG